MPSIFIPSDRDALALRVASLEPASTRHWGRMNPGQMLAHCAFAVEDACGARPVKQVFLGKLVTPFLRKLVFGPKPFGRNSPTDPQYIMAETQDFEPTRARLATAIDRMVQRGPGKAEGLVHPFFGRLTGEQWGILVYKHLDHHLRQFGV